MSCVVSPKRALFIALSLLLTAVAPGCTVYASETEKPDADVLRRSFPALAARLRESHATFAATEEGFVAPGLEIRGGGDLHALLPRRGDGVVHFTTAAGFDVRVREREASGEGAFEGQAVAYARAGGVSYWAVVDGGYEEWLLLEAGARGGVAASWEVDGAAIRQAGDVVELLDGRGVPRMRVSAPEAYEVGGRPVAARLTAREGRIELSVEATRHAVLVDPVWTSTTSMSFARREHSATRLADGRVLVVGGYDGRQSLSKVEGYDPVSRVWSSLPDLAPARQKHTATLLSNGSVLVTGGYGASYLNDSWLFDPVASSWSRAGSIAVARYQHTATLLGNGSVLVTGGFSATGASSDARLYDPSTGWSSVGPMSTARRAHTATLLGNGKVLVVGGSDGSASLSTAELYDPASGWSPAGRMNTAREGHAAVRLGNGKVLVTGGYDNTAAAANTYPASAALYDPSTHTWSTVGDAMSTPRRNHTATLLVDGTVLVAGGYFVRSGARTHVSSAESYTAAARSSPWTPLGSMSTSRAQHTATLLGDGRVLMAGGRTASAFASLTSELFDPLKKATGVSCGSPHECATGFCVDGVCCDTACGGGASDCQVCSASHGAGANGTCTLLPRDVCTTNCAGKPDGTPCEDGNPCTTGRTCQADVCTGGSPVACPPPAQCQLPGACSLITGRCEYPSKPDGTACEGDPCMLVHTCQEGICVDSVPMPCSAGTCQNTFCAAGACQTEPKEVGEACDDGDPCTAADSCNAEVCVAGVPDPTCGTSCTGKPDGTPCTDGKRCTKDDRCLGEECTGSPLCALTPGSQCYVVSCDESTIACVYETKPQGTRCDDGNACTHDDACRAEGTCQGTLISCTAADACHEAGICEPSTGACSSPEISPDDGDACTDDGCDPVNGVYHHDNTAECLPYRCAKDARAREERCQSPCESDLDCAQDEPGYPLVCTSGRCVPGHIESGCSCALPAESDAPRPWPFALLAPLLLCRRRSPRHRRPVAGRKGRPQRYTPGHETTRPYAWMLLFLASSLAIAGACSDIGIGGSGGGTSSGSSAPGGSGPGGADGGTAGAHDGGCAPDGASCTTASECCSGTCEDGTCTQACVLEGAACTSNDECCAKVCASDDVCRVPAECTPGGGGCEDDAECCSNLCDNSTSTCLTPVLCADDGVPCSVDANCCSGHCVDEICAP
ncbi:kelch repeat-containing protein [Sorangium sp. So ce1151]|uniref:kelch repeat-containing protein n=1 Tax=Sorangium sp. So ce1151 TaxID=3133332 RepID=UPI003F626C88